MIALTLTSVHLLCGVLAIGLIVGQAGLSYWAVVALVAVAALIDAVDGSIARALGQTSRLGRRLDLVADAVGFGVVPGLLLVRTASDDGPLAAGIGALAAGVYALAAVVRLARYNRQTAASPGTGIDYFNGLPTTLAGPVAAWAAGVLPPAWAGVGMVLLALLMVSPLRVPHPRTIVRGMARFVFVVFVARQAPARHLRRGSGVTRPSAGHGLRSARGRRDTTRR